MKHIIISRCNFADDALFMKYFEVMKKVFIPSVKNQNVRNFKLFFNTNNKIHPHHRELIHNEFVGSGVDVDTNIPGFKTYVVENKFNIQTRHDCDDYMEPNYLQKIQEIYAENVDKYEEFLIHAQPVKLNFYTNEEFLGGIYKDSAPSMFLSLCQKNPTKNILQEKHGQFSQIVPNVISMGLGYVKLVIHENNKLSKIGASDQKLTP